jgi:hypothetical protein
LARIAGATASKLDLRRETRIGEPGSRGIEESFPFPFFTDSLLRFSLALFLWFLTVPNMHIGFSTNP